MATTSSLRERRAARVRGLYAVTPELADTAELVRRVEAAIDGGATVVQYRNKTASAALLAAQAAELARAVAARGALFVVNDDPALAAAVDADGVHIGEEDGAIPRARALVGPDRIIGVSCYADVALAEAAIAAGADYVAFGSFFASTVKPEHVRADKSLLSRARALGVPLVAIGGIDAHNAGALVAAGADSVAVISALFAVDDVRRAAQAIARHFAPQPP
jgi:thiamine-phosphate pyrophosphorylase